MMIMIILPKQIKIASRLCAEASRKYQDGLPILAQGGIYA
jgi:hypothetical protein